MRTPVSTRHTSKETQMKKTKRIFSLALAVILLLSLSVTAFADGAGTPVYTVETQLSDDLTYQNTVSYDGTNRIESFVLEDKAGGDVFPIVLACDTIYGGMTISQVINYATGLGYNVLGAVNTDFFTTNKIPMGVVVENGILKSSPEGRNVLSINNDGSYSVSEGCTLSLHLTNAGGADSANNAGKSVSLSHLNKTRVDAGGSYLYSHHFSSVSTRTSTDGWAVKFKILSGGELTLNNALQLEVTEVYTGTEAMSLEEGYLVLTAATASYKSTDFQSFAVGDRVTLSASVSGGDLTNAKWATGAGDVLVSGGAITSSSSWDSAISGKNPRTIMGIRTDGTAVYYVADGRNSKHSVGLTLTNAAEELLNRGCTTVINFDGGGSSAMAVRLPGSSTAKVVNSPSDGSQRSCANYILFCTTGVSDGTAKRLFLDQNGKIILEGADMDLSYSAIDSGYKPTETGSVSVMTSGHGTVSGNKYTAVTAGYDDIYLRSGSISGVAGIHVTDSLTDIEIQDLSGAALSEIKLDAEGTISFSAVGKFYGEHAVTNPEQFEYTVTGDVGILQATADGIMKFTATGAPGAEGSIDINAGNKTVSIPVEIRFYFPDVVGQWYCDYVMDLYEDGIVTGATTTSYAPLKNIKRGDFLLMLYRAAGAPEVAQKQVFNDVKPTDYYASAITWAYENGIAKGTGDGTKFAPTSSLTREQAFTFVYRALDDLGINFTDGSSDALSAFSDASQVDAYAVVPTATLIKLGVVEGSDGKLSPNSSLNRAAMAKILWVTLDLK